MADVKIRNVPDWLVEWHKQKAASEGISLEERLRKLLHESMIEQRRKILKRLDALCAEIEKETGTLPDSTPLIREARQEMEERFDVRGGRQRSRQVAHPRRKAG